MRLPRKAATVAACLLSLPSVRGAYIPIEPIMGAFNLLRRGPATCPTDNTLEQCGQGFPSNFCCPSGQNCISIDNGNGVMCCPAGGTCSSIDAVAGACQAAAYNATQTPNSPIHFLNIPSTFLQCNGTSNCCPPGFQCKNDVCALQSSGTSTSIPGAAATATSAVLLSTAHSTPTATANPSSSGSITTSANAVSQPSNDFSPVAVMAGFFPGLVAGSLVAVLAVMWMGKRRKQRAAAAASLGKHSDSNSSLGPVRAQVSDPIYQDDGAGRVDFLRRVPRPSRTPTQRSSPGLNRIRSLFSVSTPSQSPRGLGVDVDSPMSSHSPHTPQHGLRREPSTESIKIFSPPEIRAESDAGDRTTKMSDLMQALGAQRYNEPLPGAYLGSPGMVDPRSRGVDNGRLR